MGGCQDMEAHSKREPTSHVYAIAVLTRINLQADMESHGISLDVRSYTALIGAAALAGDLGHARQLFDSMTGACVFAVMGCAVNSVATAYVVF